MTEHYYDHSLANVHYYTFGHGKKAMLCFHGYGMHGRQFKDLANSPLACQYTFYGFDLFFHKQTKLKDQSLAAVKKGISKKEFVSFIADFCRHQNISRFSILGYSMGSHYATMVMEGLPERVDEYIVAAPSCLGPGKIVLFLSRNRFGNKLLQKITLTDYGMLYLLKLIRRLGFVDQVGYEILYKEIATYELRFSLYATATYLRNFITDKQLLVNVLNAYSIKSIFVFGKRDRMYPPSLGKDILAQIPAAIKIEVDANHEMINANFAKVLSEALA